MSLAEDVDWELNVGPSRVPVGPRLYESHTLHDDAVRLIDRDDVSPRVKTRLVTRVRLTTRSQIAAACKPRYSHSSKVPFCAPGTGFVHT